MSGRKGSKKVRTGCITCKIRKVKCGEERPECLRCVKAGRTCDGYLDAAATSSSRGKALAIRGSRQASRASTPSIVNVSLPPWMAEAEPRETRAFDYYIRRVAPILSSELDSHFWAGLVPRLCQAEPAVRHAVISLGALYRAVDDSESKMSATLGAPDTNFAVMAYNKAISSLLSLDAGRTSGQEPTVIYLLTCILFVCIEFLQGNEKSSHAHIQQGRQLLRRIDEGGARPSSPQMEVIRRSLVPIYSRLALPCFTFGQDPVEIPPGMNLHREIPTEFGSTADARACLYSLIDDGFRASKKARLLIFDGVRGDASHLDPHEVREEQQATLSRLAAWNIAYTLYLSNRPLNSGGRGHTPGEQMLLIYYHLSYIWASNSLSASENTYDDYLDHFAHIVSLASSVQKAQGVQFPRSSMGSGVSGAGTSSPGSSSSRSASPGSENTHGMFMSAPESSSEFQGLPERPKSTAAFTFEDNLIPPIYYTAIKCRHPRLRRAALALLENASRVQPLEALWDARYVLPVAERVIQLEEGWTVDNTELGIGGGSGSADAGGISGLQAPSGYNTPGCRISPGPGADFGVPGVNSLGKLGRKKVSENHTSPFGVPEWVRVREVLIGDMKDRKEPGGTWITLFRKPLGENGEWDIQREWIPLKE
ncbi:uncharacterized protein DNG_08163 [Cephalotrichum gorgonifer]|uniref:Zn(2)-C6 fungal-type domain-containing protein n=1 Tax=Cephalotrichum gorgonifer TaxID=2041049 RepID=A0AAE8SY35_9PEZI|nr:uncharacterized protein DNG_08163 [Cephalotrichum gorgonifer]